MPVSVCPFANTRINKNININTDNNNKQVSVKFRYFSEQAFRYRHETTFVELNLVLSTQTRDKNGISLKTRFI